MAAPTVLPPHLDPRRPSRRGRGRRVLGLVAGAASSLVLLGSVAGYAAVGHYDGKVSKVDVFAKLPVAKRPGQAAIGAMNFLVLGSDNREGLTRKEANELHVGVATADNGQGRRSDSMMLVHVSANANKITQLSIPRDSLVTIPAWTDSKGVPHDSRRAKINAAYELGGPALAVATVEQATGIRIDHYVEVGFAGFVRVVDALGGVDVCTPTPLKDSKSGLDLPAGTSRVKGEQALAYVRARYIDSDFGRIGRQQDFIAQIVRQATSSDVLLNPITLNRVLDAVLGSVTTDTGLDRGEILALTQRLRTVDRRNIVFATIPYADANYVVDGLGSTVLWDDARAQQLFQAIRDDQPLGTQKQTATGSSAAPKPAGPPVVPVAPSGIRMAVLNGTGVPGVAKTTAGRLSGVGFQVVSVGNGAPVSTTTIRYDPRWSRSVQTVAAALPGATLVPVNGLGGTFQVVLGTTDQKVQQVQVGTATPTPTGDPVTTKSVADSLCRTSP